MTATIYTSGLNILAHKGLTFRSASAVAHHLTKKEASLIRMQPGYARGDLMSIKFVDGGVRLFSQVDRMWLDASLSTIPV